MCYLNQQVTCILEIYIYITWVHDVTGVNGIQVLVMLNLILYNLFLVYYNIATTVPECKIVNHIHC